MNEETLMCMLDTADDRISDCQGVDWDCGYFRGIEEVRDLVRGYFKDLMDET